MDKTDNNNFLMFFCLFLDVTRKMREFWVRVGDKGQCHEADKVGVKFVALVRDKNQVIF